MKKPVVLNSLENSTIIGRIFDTPFVVIGRNWFPFFELLLAGILTWVIGLKHPDWSLRKRTLTGSLSMVVVLGLEWCHNLAHAAAACLIHKPMDAMRIVLGMPLVVYYKLNDETVTPRQHIWRAVGGPFFNILILPLILLIKHKTRPGTITGEVATSAAWMDTFLCIGSILPIPGLDGGPILKWSLVARGQSITRADETVKKVNRISGLALLGIALAAWKNNKKFSSIMSILLAATSLAIGYGFLKEE